MSQADYFVATVATLISAWAFFGALSLHEVFFRWSIAKWVMEKSGPWGARGFFLVIAVALGAIAYRIALQSHSSATGYNQSGSNNRFHLTH